MGSSYNIFAEFCSQSAIWQGRGGCPPLKPLPPLPPLLRQRPEPPQKMGGSFPPPPQTFSTIPVELLTLHARVSPLHMIHYTYHIPGMLHGTWKKQGKGVDLVFEFSPQLEMPA